MPRRICTIVAVLAGSILVLAITEVKSYKLLPEVGYPVGFLPDCPGNLKNTTLSAKAMKALVVMVFKPTPRGIMRREMPLTKAVKILANDKEIDFKNRKTLLYAIGFVETYNFPHTQALAMTYARKGYNVIITQTFELLTYIYPKSARLVRPIGKALGDFLAKLTEQGLKAENLELTGLSLGAHVVGYAAKQFYAVTGKKPSRITGADPAGPCFRYVSAEHRLDSSDAERVDIIHTNIDGFGIAERLGHVDFYVNGGEFQPGDIEYIPCLVICSHIKSFLYLWQAIENPKMFIGVKCNSIQEARLSNCYNNTETNYLGSETDFSKPGIYYLGTRNRFPYYAGKDGLRSDKEIYTSTIRRINAGDEFVAKR